MNAPSGGQPPGTLTRSWIHVREEETPGLLAFRPEGSALPPARGRGSLRLTEDGRYQRRTPGPDDRSVVIQGTWTLAGARLELVPQAGESVCFEVVLVTDERLLLRPEQVTEPPPGPAEEERP